MDVGNLNGFCLEPHTGDIGDCGWSLDPLEPHTGDIGDLGWSTGNVKDPLELAELGVTGSLGEEDASVNEKVRLLVLWELSMLAAEAHKVNLFQ